MLKQSRFLAITAAALALSIGSVNAASAAAPDTPPPGGPGMMGGPGGHHGGMQMKKELDKLHGQLNLNVDQEKSWQAALTTMQQNHQAMRESHKQMHAQMESMK